MKKNIYYICFSTFLIDLFTKTLIIKNIKELTKLVVIPNFFNITYLKNTGAAWSLFNDSTFILIIISAIVFIILNNYINKIKSFNKLNTISFGLVLGGILGNLLDRIAYGYVIDFLSFKIFNYNFPVFNVADMALVIGVILLIFEIIRGEKNEFNSRKRKD